MQVLEIITIYHHLLVTIKVFLVIFFFFLMLFDVIIYLMLVEVKDVIFVLHQDVQDDVNEVVVLEV